jgi:hypothetical protein
MGSAFLENQNFRTFPTTCSTCSTHEEGVAPGLKPYKQHEYTVGVDYQLTRTLTFEAATTAAAFGYGQPNQYQAGRAIRIGVRFTF